MKKAFLVLALMPLVAACGGQPAPSSSATSSQAVTSSQAATSSQQTTSSAQTSSAEASSAATSEATSSAATSSQDSGPKYLFYKIKDGETAEGLTGSPWLNSTYPGIVSKIQTPSLKDDFFVATNYDALATATLDPGQPATGGMLSALAAVEKNASKLYAGQGTGNYAPAVKKMHELFAAENKDSEKAAVKALLDRVSAITTIEGIRDFFCSVDGATMPWSAFETYRNAKGLRIESPAVGWNANTSYSAFANADQAEMARFIEKYARILSYFGVDAGRAAHVAELGLKSQAKTFTGNASAKTLKVGEFAESYPKSKWGDLFRSLGYADDAEISIESRIANFLQALEDAEMSSLESLKDDLIVRICLGAVAAMPTNDYIALAREFDSSMANYPDDMLMRETFVTSVQSVFDRAYIDNFETPARKKAIHDLMAETIAEYKVLLQNEPWLGSQTKAKAVEKLEAMQYDCCYPEHLLSLPSYSVGEPTSFYQATREYRAWNAKSDQPARSPMQSWVISVTAINGVYYPLNNSFVIYEGLLGGMMDGLPSTREELLGSIGAVIGHEISHAFDAEGSKYDAHGMEEEWWTPEDRRAFNEKVAKVKATWDTYSYRPNLPMWTEKMLGEIIADMGGVSICLKLGAKDSSFDYDKFFRAYSASYCSVMDPNFVEASIIQAQDAHPLNYLRVNAVVNQFKEFYDTYGVAEGDHMYVAPANRINIW